jgi:putative sterol carrier protein
VRTIRPNAITLRGLTSQNRIVAVKIIIEGGSFRMSEELTIEKLMNRMPKAFRPEKANGVNTVLQFHLTGAEAGDWIATIKNGECEVQPGVAENPNLTLTADSQDYKDIFTGKSNAMQAFMTGKLKLAGDLMQAMKIPEYFKMS